MLHEVKILTPDGKLKKLISSKELHLDHWKQFEELGNDLNIGKLSRGRIVQQVKKQLEVEFPEFMDESI